MKHTSLKLARRYMRRIALSVAEKVRSSKLNPSSDMLSKRYFKTNGSLMSCRSCSARKAL
jgi:hypothetical protein